MIPTAQRRGWTSSMKRDNSESPEIDGGSPGAVKCASELPAKARTEERSRPSRRSSRHRGPRCRTRRRILRLKRQFYAATVHGVLGRSTPMLQRWLGGNLTLRPRSAPPSSPAETGSVHPRSTVASESAASDAKGELSEIVVTQETG